MKPFGALITDATGLRLTAEEKALFADTNPFGFIIFARNVESPDQLRALCDDFREAVGREAFITVDQEGGRVQRLRKPHWRDWPDALAFVQQAGAHAKEAMYLRGRIIAHELRGVGLDSNCAPNLDVLTDNTHPFLVSRCYGDDPMQVAALGRAFAEGMLAGGVVPIMKHMPGHGRTTHDTHFDLPRVTANRATLAQSDFAPFKAMKDQPMGMTGHLVFEAIDETPATLSHKVIEVIRREIGFEGLLVTDDISMKALSGPPQLDAAAALAAGCDVALLCNASLEERAATARAAGEMSAISQARALRALKARKTPDAVDISALDAQLAALLGGLCMADTPFQEDTISVADRMAAEALIIDVEGYEGPLDLLLQLSRTQKVDLRRVSVLQLARQYLAFVEKAKELRLELAADYLVMAAWLAFLKSRLLLPPDPSEEGPSGEELAAHLAFQLERLQAMRDVAARLMARDQLGRDFFARGQTHEVKRVRRVTYTATLLDLMQGYARIRTRDEFRPFVMDREKVFTMEQALERMRGLIGYAGDWGDLLSFLPEGWESDPVRRRSATASTFAASLELVKEGHLEIRPKRDFRADPIAQTGQTAMSEEEPNTAPHEDAEESLFEAPPMAEQERMIEAVLFATSEPITLKELEARMPHGCDAGEAMVYLRKRYDGRGVQVMKIGDGYAMRTASDLGFLMQKETVEVRKLSRAAIETLAIIAYHQPATRAEIEEIRGVSVSRGTVDQLLELEWIRLGRRKMTPGRPVTFVVTQGFLDHFGLENARDLPGVKELRSAGLLENRPPPGLAPMLGEGEEGDEETTEGQSELFED